MYQQADLPATQGESAQIRLLLLHLTSGSGFGFVSVCSDGECRTHGVSSTLPYLTWEQRGIGDAVPSCRTFSLSALFLSVILAIRLVLADAQLSSRGNQTLRNARAESGSRLFRSIQRGRRFRKSPAMSLCHQLNHYLHCVHLQTLDGSSWDGSHRKALTTNTNPLSW